MKVILMSSPGDWNGGTQKEEVALVNSLLERGLERFHLRKPKFSIDQIRKWLDRIPSQYHSRVVIHSYHDLALEYDLCGIHTSERQRTLISQSQDQVQYLLAQNPELQLSSSFHKLDELADAPKIYQYTFISPVFDSISKSHHTAAFKEEDLVDAVHQARNPVIALGGINLSRLDKIRMMGFSGIGLLGAIWNATDPIASFLEISSACGRGSELRQTA